MDNTERIAEIKRRRVQVDELNRIIREVQAAAPPKPDTVSADDLPEAIAVQAAERELDAALDAENLRRDTPEVLALATAAAEKALINARAKRSRAEEARDRAIELAQRRFDAHQRLIEPLRNERDEHGRAIDHLMWEIEDAQREQAAQDMRQAAETLARAIAKTIAASEILLHRQRRVMPGSPPPIVLGDQLVNLPIAPGTAAFADCDGGSLRLILNLKLLPTLPNDIRVDPVPLRIAMQRALDEQLRDKVPATLDA